MNKIILKVRQPRGMIFKLNGRKIRTPFDIDVTHLKIDNIVKQIKSYGITDFEISTTKNKPIDNKEEDEKIIILDSKSDEIERLESKIEKLEKIINNIIKQNKDKEKEREQNINDNTKIIEKNKDCIKSFDNIQTKKIIIEELNDSNLDEEIIEFKSNDFKMKDIDNSNHFSSLSSVEELTKFKK